MAFIEDLATRLGVAVEYLWTVLVKQQFAEGVTSLAITLINLIVVFIVLRFAPKLTMKAVNQKEKLAADRQKNGTGYHGSYSVTSETEDFFGVMRFVIPILSTIFVMILLKVTTTAVTTGIQQLINPDYFALKEILDAIAAGQ